MRGRWGSGGDRVGGSWGECRRQVGSVCGQEGAGWEWMWGVYRGGRRKVGSVLKGRWDCVCVCIVGRGGCQIGSV